MAKKAKKDNKNMIIGVCCAVVVVVVVVIAAVALATSGGNKLNDNYFVSDDTKYVLTIESDESALNEDDEAAVYMPIRTHLVYTYEGDTVTGLKSYSEYADAAAAQKAYDYMVEIGEDLNDAVVEGKYIVMTAPAEQYEGLTASDVKQQIEFMEALQNMNFDELEEAEEVEDTEEIEE